MRLLNAWYWLKAEKGCLPFGYIAINTSSNNKNNRFMKFLKIFETTISLKTKYPNPNLYFKYWNVSRIKLKIFAKKEHHIKARLSSGRWACNIFAKANTISQSSQIISVVTRCEILMLFNCLITIIIKIIFQKTIPQ